MLHLVLPDRLFGLSSVLGLHLAVWFSFVLGSKPRLPTCHEGGQPIVLSLFSPGGHSLK